MWNWKGKNDAEMEFLIEYNGNIYPMDVKKGRGTMNSLTKYRNHNINTPVFKISKNYLGYDNENKILTVPLYSLFLLLSDIQNNKFDIK